MPLTPEEEEAIQLIEGAIAYLIDAKQNLEPVELLPQPGDPYVNPLQAHADILDAIACLQDALAVLYQIPGDPRIQLTPSSLEFEEGYGAQTVTVRNIGEGTLVVMPTIENTPWVVARPNGHLYIPAGESQTAEIEVLWNYPLPPNLEDPTLVTAPFIHNGVNVASPIDMIVTVHPPSPEPPPEDPILMVGTEDMAFEWDGNSTSDNEVFEVWNGGNGSMLYSISDDLSGLAVTPASGESGGEHNQHNATVTWSSFTEGEIVNGEITVTTEEQEPPPPPGDGTASSESLDHNTAKHLDPGTMAANRWVLNFTSSAPGNVFDSKATDGLCAWEERLYSGYADLSAGAPRTIEISRTAVGGDDFADVTDGDDTGATYTCIVPSADLESKLFAIESNTTNATGKIWESTDGDTWTLSKDEGTYISGEALLTMPDKGWTLAAFSSPHNLGGGSASGTIVYYTEDEGTTWTALGAMTNFYCKKLVRFGDHIYALGAYSPAAAMWDDTASYSRIYRADNTIPGMATWVEVLEASLGAAADGGPVVCGSSFGEGMWVGTQSDGSWTPKTFRTTNGTTWLDTSSVGTLNNSTWVDNGNTAASYDSIFVHNGIMYILRGSGGKHASGTDSIVAEIHAFHGGPVLSTLVKRWQGDTDNICGFWGVCSREEFLVMLLKGPGAGGVALNTRYVSIEHADSASADFADRVGATRVSGLDFTAQTKTINVVVNKPDQGGGEPPPEGDCNLVQWISAGPSYPGGIGVVTVNGGAWDGWCVKSGYNPPPTGPNGEKEFERGNWAGKYVDLGNDVWRQYEIMMPQSWFLSYCGDESYPEVPGAPNPAGGHLEGWGLSPTGGNRPHSLKICVELPNNWCLNGLRVVLKGQMNGQSWAQASGDALTGSQVFYPDQYWTRVTTNFHFDPVQGKLTGTVQMKVLTSGGYDSGQRSISIDSGGALGGMPIAMGEIIKWGGVYGSRYGNALIRNESYGALDSAGRPSGRKATAKPTTILGTATDQSATD